MIYRTFKEWKNGNYLEDLEPRKEAYTRDELLLIEMGWKYGFDAGVEAGRKDENEACAKVCDEQAQRSRESSEKAKRERDSFMYHHCSVTAKWNAAAIRARREQ